MKKNLFFGLALFGVAFAGAAFTSKRGLQTPHYILKSGVCEAIPNTGCEDPGQTCFYNEAGVSYPVYQNQTSEQACNTRLRTN